MSELGQGPHPCPGQRRTRLPVTASTVAVLEREGAETRTPAAVSSAGCTLRGRRSCCGSLQESVPWGLGPGPGWRVQPSGIRRGGSHGCLAGSHLYAFRRALAVTGWTVTGLGCLRLVLPGTAFSPCTTACRPAPPRTHAPVKRTCSAAQSPLPRAQPPEQIAGHEPDGHGDDDAHHNHRTPIADSRSTRSGASAAARLRWFPMHRAGAPAPPGPRRR
jgi:hypothetical protein